MTPSEIIERLPVAIAQAKVGNKFENLIDEICPSKNLKGIYSQKRLDHAKISAGDALKNNSKRVIQITLEATGNLSGNKIADKIKNISLQNSSETDLHTEEIPKNQ